MEHQMTIAEFYSEMFDEFLKSKGSGDFQTDDEHYTNLVFEQLVEAGEANEPNLYYYRSNGLQMSGFEIEDDSSITLYVTHFVNSKEIVSVPKSEIMNSINRCLSIFKKAMFNKFESFSNEQDLYELCQNILKNGKTINQVNVICITNGVVKDLSVPAAKLANVIIKSSVWDIDRLYKCMSSGAVREPIVVDFVKRTGKPLPALKGGESDKTNVYVSVVSGELLANLYKEHKDKLLERNVRTYLQKKSKVNKGIIETIQDCPDLFLAYNNGITVTATGVTIKDSTDPCDLSVQVESIDDFQIVNGGQTTVSMYQALISPNFEADLSHTYVQMKLAVVPSSAYLDEILPNISKFSNSQNSVQNADFASNEPYHRQMEQLSRSIWSPSVEGTKPVQWFYERARGQYQNALNSEATTSKRKLFKETHHLVTKTDLAKVLLSWDGKPTTVAKGAQKCFAEFMDSSEHIKYIPNEDYFKRSMAKTILFRKLEKIVLARRFGGYKADIVAYTYYKLMLLTEKKIDLDAIWKAQDISDALRAELDELCAKVRNHILKASNGSNVSEFCKGNKCKKGIEDLPHSLSATLKKELLSEALPVITEEQKNTTIALTKEEEALVEECFAISSSEWQKMAIWAKEGGFFSLKERNVLFRMFANKKRGNKATPSEAKNALKIHEKAIKEGFVC